MLGDNTYEVEYLKKYKIQALFSLSKKVRDTGQL